MLLMYNNMQDIFFTGPEACSMVGAPGERINNPHLEEYTVFIQNSGGGNRSLNPGTRLLYDQTASV